MAKLFVRTHRSIRPSRARATCVYVNVCVRAGRERTIRVLLRRMVSRHTPGWRLRVHLFGQKDLVGPPCPSSRLFFFARLHPLTLQSISRHSILCIFLLPLPCLDRQSTKRIMCALYVCRPASFSKLGPRVDNPSIRPEGKRFGGEIRVSMTKG